MFCPKCEGEYVPGVRRCPTCDVPLVDAPASASRQAAQPEPVTVFSSGDAGLIALAKSILHAANIGFGVCGEGVQDLFGYGRFPLGHSVAVGPVRLVVAHEDAADAREFLSTLASNPSPGDGSGECDDVEVGRMSRSWRLARTIARVAAVVILVGLVVELAWSFVAGFFL